MKFLQRIVCELHKKFEEGEQGNHPGPDCWYFLGPRDFLKYMFQYIEDHPAFASEMLNAIIDEEKADDT